MIRFFPISPLKGKIGRLICKLIGLSVPAEMKDPRVFVGPRIFFIFFGSRTLLLPPS